MQIQWKWTVPNVLSLVRIGILPVFIFLYIRSCNVDSVVLMYTAFGLLILSGLTDCFDGWIARRFHQESEIGKLLDPVADKLTQVAVLLALTTQYREFLPLLLLCTVKELLQGLGGLIVLGKGMEMRSSKWYGKMSTVVFYIAVAAIVLWKDMPHWLVLTLVALVAVLMLFAFLRYLQLFLNIRKEDVPSGTAEVEGSNGK